jgi:chromosome segregation ATPase
VNTTVAHRRNLTTSDALQASHSATIEAQSKEIISLKSRSSEADFEIRRLTDQLRLARIQSSELTDRVVLIQSERDFFKMKWGEANPEEAKSLDRAASKSSYEFLKAQAETEGREPPTPPDDALSGDECTPHDEARAAEKDRVTAAIAGYLREIDSLKKQIAEHEQMAKLRSAAADNLDEGDIYLEGELTSNVAKVIAQTEQHLIQEARKLKTLVSDPSVIVGSDGAVDAVIAAALENAEDDEDDGDDDKDKIYQKEAQIEVDTTAFQRRQKIMTREVSELGESIQLKEQLVNQLRRSHYQYGVMKTFYEQKLQALNEEMAAKEEERETLLRELHELEQTKHEAEAIKHKVDRQARLRDELSKKDAELQSLKKRQQELNSLSQVQSKYQQQMVKLETEIEAMKKQRVDLTKSIQTDKKKHLQALTDKAREIETLKRALNKSMIEAKKLGKDKERAEERAKEVSQI